MRKPGFDAREAALSYLVTAGLIFCVYLVWVVWTEPTKEWASHKDILFSMFSMPPVLPLLLTIFGFFIGVARLQEHDYPQAALAFAIMLSGGVTWRGVWYAMYGRNQRP